MFDSKEFSGYWWTSETEGRKVPGILQFNQEDGPILKLFSTIEEEPNIDTNSSNKKERILGKTISGDDVTILDTIVKSRPNLNGVSTEIYQGNIVLIGHCFSNEIEFSKGKIKSDTIDAWAERSATSADSSLFDKESEGAVSAEVGDTFEIKAEIPENLVADLESAKIKLRNEISTNIERRGGGKIADECYFQVENKEGKMNLSELLDYTKKIENFVSLAVGKECWAEELVGIGIDDKTTIEILYVTETSEKPDHKIHPYKTNFILPDIYDNYGEVMKSWFETCSKHKESIDLYFSTRYNDRMYITNQFISLIQAIEVYHRQADRFDGEYLEDEKFSNYYDELCETIKEDFDNSFTQHLKKGTFKFANEYSLAKRLKMIVEENIEVLKELPLEVKKNIRPIVDARNNLTHEGDAGVNTDRLYEFSVILRAIFETLILLDIDIEQEHIIDRLGKRYTEISRGF